jgi:hypothetical protein
MELKEKNNGYKVVVQKLESKILYSEHMEESNLKEWNWIENGKSTEM